MGSLWEPCGKGVPFLGAPGNSLDVWVNLEGRECFCKILVSTGLPHPGTNHQTFQVPKMEVLTYISSM